MKIKGAIFDMDGVLLNSEILYQRFWLMALEHFGYNPEPEQMLQLQSLSGKNAEKKLKEFFGEQLDYQRTKQKRIELMDSYIEQNGVEMKNGADTTLKALKEMGLRTALATSSPSERAKNHLSRVGIYDYFDKYICGEMVQNSKPAPDIYLMACEKLGLNPDECIAVEDSQNGAISAITAGCRTIVVPDISPCSDKVLKEAFAVTDSIINIPKIISAYV